MLRKYEKRIKEKFRIFVLFRNFVAGEGFTLIEVVVGTSVFAVTIAGVLGVYASIQRLNQYSESLQALQQNTRFISADVTKLIANGRIDYARYGVTGIPQPVASELYLIDRTGAQVRLFLQGDDLILEKGGAGTSAFSSKGVNVLDFQVYAWPAANPFPGGLEQPTVTLFFDLESTLNPGQPVRLPFQITAATREYPE